MFQVASKCLYFCQSVFFNLGFCLRSLKLEFFKSSGKKLQVVLSFLCICYQ